MHVDVVDIPMSTRSGLLLVQRRTCAICTMTGSGTATGYNSRRDGAGHWEGHPGPLRLVAMHKYKVSKSPTCGFLFLIAIFDNYITSHFHRFYAFSLNGTRML